MAKRSIKREVSQSGLGSSEKKSERNKALAMESIGSLIQLHKLQGVLLGKLQEQIRKIRTR